MTRKLAITLTAVLASVILVVGIVITVALGALNASTQESDYRACIEAGGLHEATSSQEMAPIAERCYAAVYGD